MRFTEEEHLLRLTALQPLNQSDREPLTYAIKGKVKKKAVGMRTFKTLATDGKTIISVPFISAESVVHQLREALWLSVLQDHQLTLKDFRNPAGALLTYMMMNGGDTSIGRKLHAVKDVDTIAAMPYRFPAFGAFGGTIAGTFFESFVRVSFVLPFIQDLPHWTWYFKNADPDSRQVPANVFTSHIFAHATAKEDSDAVSYFRHPEPMGPFWGSPPPRNASDNENDAEPSTPSEPNAIEGDTEDVLEIGATTPELPELPDDAKNVFRTMNPMPHTFEYIAAGVPLAFTLKFAQESNAVLRGAVRYAFDHWLDARHQVSLGGHVNRGFGLVQFENFPPNETFPSADPFLEWLERHHDRLDDLLHRFASQTGLPGTRDLAMDPEPLFTMIDALFAE